jgi:hypothetical protein
MNQQKISIQVESWIDEEELPVRATLKVIRKNDPNCGLSEDEIIDHNEFIRCYILRDLEPLLLIPEDDSEEDFVVKKYIESAFNTWDFVNKHPRKPFSAYHFRIKEIMEKAKELAIMHSCISHKEGRENTKKRVNSLIDSEFRDEATMLTDTLKKYPKLVDRSKLLDRLASLNSIIRRCYQIWMEHAYME